MSYSTMEDRIFVCTRGNETLPVLKRAAARGVNLCCLALLVVSAATLALGQDGFHRKTIITNVTPGVNGFANPTTMAIAPDGRLFVGQSNGRIHAFTLEGIS